MAIYQGPGAELINQKLNDYWARIATSYYVPDVFGRRIVQGYMTKLKPQSLIEVGCGSGELFSAFKEIPKVVAVDWQDKMLERSAARIQRHEYKNITLAKVDITKQADVLPLTIYIGDTIEPKPFEIALTRTVLMHIAPEDIEAACRNMTLLSDHIIAFEYVSKFNTQLASHNWNHDYVKIFHYLGYQMVEAYQRPDEVSQLLFRFQRTKS